MSDDSVNVLALTRCGCGCRNCLRHEEGIAEAMVALAVSKRTTLSERLPLEADDSVDAIADAKQGSDRRLRGQQPGRSGHSRRRYEHLPLAAELILEPPPRELVYGSVQHFWSSTGLSA